MSLANLVFSITAPTTFVAKIDSATGGPFASYNATTGPYAAWLGIFNAVTPASNTHLTFTSGSNAVTGVTVVDMTVGNPVYSRLNSNGSPMTATSPWPTVTAVTSTVSPVSFSMSSPAIQSGSGYAVFGLTSGSGVGKYGCTMSMTSGFPSGTQWTWTFPSEVQPAVYGYPNVSYGCVNSGFNAGPTSKPPAIHPGMFNSLTHTFNISLNLTTPEDIDWLIETWVSTATSPPVTGTNTATNEVGLIAYCPPSLWTYIQTQPKNPSIIVGGVTYYVATRAISPPFTMMVPLNSSGSPLNLCDGTTRTVDFGALLAGLVANGVISNSNYIIGYDSGPEIRQNSGSAVASVFNWTWS